MKQMDGDRDILGDIKMKHIFFVITFASIYDRVLPLMEEKKDKGEIIVVAATDQIEMFFKNYTDFKVIRIKVHPNLITRKTKHRILSNIIRSKFEFRELFKDIEKSEVYFCNMGFAVVMYSYIKKLSRRNKVIFYGHWGKMSEKAVIKYPVEHSMRAFAMRWIAKWMMGVETIIHRKLGIPIWGLDQKFFENIDILENYIGDKKLLDKYMKKLDVLKGKKILIAINDAVTSGFIEKTEFISKMDNLMDILDDIAPGEYIIKPHPRLNKLYGKMSECNEIIPPYIPLEFILRHDWKKIIGIDSGSLVSSIKYTDAEVISLIDVVEYRDGELKKMLRDHLEKNSQNKIKFLKEIEELKQILK